jgi:hypothetical protein
MDTPLHLLAVPDADRSKLKRPEVAAQEIVDQVSDSFASPGAGLLQVQQ